MPKQKTDDLITLINSLSRAEKRHFRLFVKRNQTSEDILFLQLFDFLEKRGEYDEEQILKKLTEIKKTQLSNLKAHLYKQLLTSLRLLNTRSSQDIYIRELLDCSRVLYNKGLYRQALDMLDKAKQKAKLSEFSALSLEILEFEKHIEGQYITRSIEGRADVITNETIALLNIIENNHQFSNLSLQLYGLYLKIGFVRNFKDYEMVKLFFNAKLPPKPYGDLDFMSKIYHDQSHVWFYHMTQDFPYCYKYASRWVSLFEQNPEMIQIQGILYLKGLHNLLTSLFNMWQYDKYCMVLNKLLTFPERYPIDREMNMEGNFYLFKFNHIIKKHFLEGTFDEGIRIIPPLMNLIHLDQYNWDHHRIMVFYYRIACLYFGAGENKNAITYLNLILNEKNSDYRTDIQIYARILSLIAHYELGNAQLVEYQVKSVYRFLSKMEELSAVHREIFRFIRKLPRIHSVNIQEEFLSLRNKLEQLELDPYEKRPFLYLDIISWLDSKITGKTVQEIIKQKSWDRRKKILI
jgi:tetratricopeptide (TPR) repeat protein